VTKVCFGKAQKPYPTPRVPGRELVIYSYVLLPSLHERTAPDKSVKEAADGNLHTLTVF